MEPDSINMEQALYGLMIISAIPVVILALWADYFERHLSALVFEDPALEGNLEIQKVKMASLCALVSQVLFLMGSFDIWQVFPVSSALCFALAISAQIYIQVRTEGLVRAKLGAYADAIDNILVISLKAVGCWILGVVLHIVFLVVAFGIAGLFLYKSQPSLLSGILALSLIGVFGLMAGIYVNFALAPIYFKTIFPARKLEEGLFKKKIEACFSNFGFDSPELWVLKLNELRVTQNILVGLKGSRGFLRPALLISNLVLSSLSEVEFEAIILNQVSHFVLKHSRKRGVLTFGLILSTTILASLFVYFGQRFALEGTSIEMVGAIISIIIFLSSIRILYLQTQKHEEEADFHTIMNMGVSTEVFASALRKLDSLIDPGQLGYPDTEKRIQRLNSLKKDQKLDQAA